VSLSWAGIFHVLATPFRDDGALDREGLPRLVERALSAGVRGLTILGIAGEAHRLADEERRQVVEVVVKEVGGRVPVVVGASAPGTHLAMAFARMAQEHGADALMAAPPAGVRDLEAVAEYYQAVAGACRLPLVLQDEPVTTQVTMPVPFLARLATEVPRVAAVKLEAAPTLPKITGLARATAGRMAIFGGLGGLYVFEELERGAAGAMTGFPYPEALVEIQAHLTAGRREAARALFHRWLPLIRYESQPGSAPGTSVGIRKEILRRRGWIASARVRPPAPVLDAETLDELTDLLAAVGAPAER
jgi:4-hydroxy-tetrahydrodipicolinate synthase